jgi:hypothetical protein
MMTDAEDVVNEILRTTSPGFKQASLKRVSDAPENRAKPEAQSPDLSYVRSKLGQESPASDSPGAADAGNVILRIMGTTAADTDAKTPRDTRIVKIENDEGQKTRTVLDVTGKKQIGASS